MTYDDGLLRIGIMAQFSFVEPLSTSENRIVVGTTHLYWDSSEADVQQRELRHFLSSLALFNDSKAPLIVTGDFNSERTSEIYKIMQTGNNGRVPFRFRHAYRNYENSGTEPPYSNYTNFGPIWIDYIWYWVPESASHKWRVDEVLAIPSEAAVNLNDRGLPNAVFPSDHLPIGAAISILDAGAAS